jgi:hypothetical protein
VASKTLQQLVRREPIKIGCPAELSVDQSLGERPDAELVFRREAE